MIEGGCKPPNSQVLSSTKEDDTTQELNNDT